MEFKRKGPYLIVSVGKDLDHHQAQQIQKGIYRIQNEGGFRHILFDFEQTEFMDSSGVGMIIGYYKEMSALGGRVTVSGVHPRIEKLFYVSGLHKIIKTYSKVEDVFHE